MMTKREFIAYLFAADDLIDDKVKAAISMAVSLMPRKKYEVFAVEAEKGIALLRAGDFDGVRALLSEHGASEDDLKSADALFDALRARPDALAKLNDTHTV